MPCITEMFPTWGFKRFPIPDLKSVGRPNAPVGCPRLQGDFPAGFALFSGRLCAMLRFMASLWNQRDPSWRDSRRRVPGGGGLALTNFTPASPIKVMAIGDSITDDCVTNGAWRAFLQPLLESNGYPFTFVGRQVSVASPATFTKPSMKVIAGRYRCARG